MKRNPKKEANGKPKRQAKDEEFIELADSCFFTQGNRKSNYDTWRNFYYQGSDTEIVPVNRVYGEINNLLSLIISPEQILLEGVPMPPNLTEEDPEQIILDQICDIVKDNFFGNRMDIDILLALLFSLIDGNAILKLHWSDTTHSVKYIHIQPDLFGVIYEGLKIDDPAQIFCEKTELTKAQVQRYYPSIWPQIAQKEAQEEQKLEESGALRVLLGGQGSTEAQIQVRQTFDFKPKAALLTYTKKELWQFEPDEEQWRRTVIIGDQVAHDHLFGQAWHIYHNLKPLPIPNYFWGLSAVYLLHKIQERRNKFLEDPECGLSKAIELLLNPPAVTTGYNIGFETFKASWTEMRKAGGLAELQGQDAKIEPFIPKLGIPEGFQIIEFYDLQQKFILGINEILMGQAQKNVRAQGYASMLAQFASSQVKRDAHTIEAQLEEVFTKTGYLYQVNDPTLYRRTQDKNVREFQLFQYSKEYRIEIYAHTGSPITTEQNINLLMSLRKIGDLPRWILTHILPLPFKSKIMAWIKKSDEAMAQEKQKQMEILEKSGTAGGQKIPAGVFSKIFGGRKEGR